MTAPKDTVLTSTKGSVPVAELSFDDEEKMIREVNGKYNQSITYQRGKAGWQLDDLPDGGEGDCDTFARTKGEALVRAGFNKDKLAIVTAKLWNGVDHALLQVERGDGKFVYLTNPQNRMQSQYPEATILNELPGERNGVAMGYDSWEVMRDIARQRANK